MDSAASRASHRSRHISQQALRPVECFHASVRRHQQVFIDRLIRCPPEDHRVQGNCHDRADQNHRGALFST